jgi:hypothetical protein
MWKVLLLLPLFLRSYCAVAQYNFTSFYIVAHSDDWQLFMGVNAFNDIRTKEGKVVIIYTTAGDNNTGASRFAAARQSGAEKSIEFCSDLGSPHSFWYSSLDTVRAYGTDHIILRKEYKNVVCYYLRLPDGCKENFNNTNTLSKFFRTSGAPGYYSYCSRAPWTFPQEVPALADIDNNTTYTSYDDLKETLFTIIKSQSAGIPEVWINTHDPYLSSNADDHPDHITTGILAADLAHMVTPCCNLALYMGYRSMHEPPNLTQDELSMERALLDQVSYAMLHEGFADEWDADHIRWTNTNYFGIPLSCNGSIRSERADIKKMYRPISANLLQVYPNPASAKIMIEYMVTKEGPVQIAVHDIHGKKIAQIVNERKSTGNYSYEYNIEVLPAAVYTISINTPGYTRSLLFTRK